MDLKIKLTVMNFLEFAVWGAYLTCMGIYLGNIGLGTHIGSFYAMQGIVSIFMPAIMNHCRPLDSSTAFVGHLPPVCRPVHVWHGLV